MSHSNRLKPRRALWQTLAIVWQNLATLWQKLATLWQTFAIRCLLVSGCVFSMVAAQEPPTKATKTTANAAKAAKAAKESELVRLAYSDALTTEEKAEKNAARAELNKLGLDKLRVLFDHVHVPNMYIRFDIDPMVHRNRDKVGPTLLPFLDSPHVRTRSYATYYLSFTPLREHREKIVPLLDHDGTRTSAIRTLGKWAATNHLDKVTALLDNKSERRRITAINAVRDIGDPTAAPALLPSLDDPVLTVRFVAERALAKLGDKKILRKALKSASPKATWHLNNALKTIREDEKAAEENP